jgi:predicted nucleic-acid-binding Zn-ribbon protein
MPGTSTTEIKCIKCKRTYEAVVIDHIDLSQDSDLIKKIESGKVNRVQCPKCRKVQYLDRSIVINFEPQNIIAVYDPDAKSSAAKEELQRDFENVTSFNETLTEIGEEIEFQVFVKLADLKPLLDNYSKLYG